MQRIFISSTGRRTEIFTPTFSVFLLTIHMSASSLGNVNILTAFPSRRTKLRMKETVRDAILDVFKLPFHLSMHDTDRFENDAPFRNSPLFKPFSQVFICINVFGCFTECGWWEKCIKMCAFSLKNAFEWTKLLELLFNEALFQKLPLPYACNSLVEYLLSEVVSIAI